MEKMLIQTGDRAPIQLLLLSAVLLLNDGKDDSDNRDHKCPGQDVAICSECCHYRVLRSISIPANTIAVQAAPRSTIC